MNVAGLVVALGNPGQQYQNTRHNLGWLVLDELLDLLARQHMSLQTLKSPKGPFELWRCNPGGAFNCWKEGEWLFCKPQTYMNLSGEAVGVLAHFYRIAPEDILVLHDEIDLPLGRIRLKKGGSTAGHNGLKSLNSHLGSSAFVRMRFGVGKPEVGEVSNYVLAKFRPHEQADVKEVVDFGAKASLAYMCQGFAAVVQEVNSFRLLRDEKSEPDT